MQCDFAFGLSSDALFPAIRYLVLTYGQNPSQNTVVRHSSLTPQWNQTVDFPVWKIPPQISGLEEPRLLVKCWDWEEKDQHNYMGSTEVAVEDLKMDGEQQGTSAYCDEMDDTA